MASGWDEYNKSKVAAPTGYDTSIYGASTSSVDKKTGEGTYSNEIAMSLIFFAEIQRMSQQINVPNFDMGPITEILGKGKYKVKLQCKGSVITASSTMEENAALFSWSKPEALYKKGGLALVLMTNSNPSSPNGVITYTIVSVKTFNNPGDPTVPVYPV